MLFLILLFKQKTAYEMRISDWSSDVCSSDLVVLDQKLVEKHAKKMGIGDVKVTMHRFSGGSAMNQALLSDSIDLAAGGVAPLLKLWDKTVGTKNEEVGSGSGRARVIRSM